jgi:hypothetical protein
VFDDAFTCIVGLAYPGMKAGHDWNVPFFDNLMKLGMTTFAFDFGNTPSLEFNPAVDEEKVVWHPVVN